jgi:hypothetical protein
MRPRITEKGVTKIGSHKTNLTPHPTLYLQAGNRNRVTAKTHSRYAEFIYSSISLQPIHVNETHLITILAVLTKCAIRSARNFTISITRSVPRIEITSQIESRSANHPSEKIDFDFFWSNKATRV